MNFINYGVINSYKIIFIMTIKLSIPSKGKDVAIYKALTTEFQLLTWLYYYNSEITKIELPKILHIVLQKNLMGEKVSGSLSDPYVFFDIDFETYYKLPIGARFKFNFEILIEATRLVVEKLNNEERQIDETIIDAAHARFRSIDFSQYIPIHSMQSTKCDETVVIEVSLAEQKLFLSAYNKNEYIGRIPIDHIRSHFIYYFPFFKKFRFKKNKSVDEVTIQRETIALTADFSRQKIFWVKKGKRPLSIAEKTDMLSLFVSFNDRIVRDKYKDKLNTLSDDDYLAFINQEMDQVNLLT